MYGQDEEQREWETERHRGRKLLGRVSRTYIYGVREWIVSFSIGRIGDISHWEEKRRRGERGMEGRRRGDWEQVYTPSLSAEVGCALQ